MPNIIAPVFQLDRISPTLEAVLGATMARMANQEARAQAKPTASQRAKKVILPGGVTVGGLQFLRLVMQAPMSTRQIADARGLTLNSQSHMCLAYFKKGWVTRERRNGPGVPHHVYSITDAGRAAVAEAEKEA